MLAFLVLPALIATTGPVNGIAYDNITGHPSRAYYPHPEGREMADDLKLASIEDPISEATVSFVSLTWSGSMTVRIYRVDGVTGLPGQMLGSGTTPIFAQGQPYHEVTIVFSKPIQLDSRSIWLSWQFNNWTQGGPGVLSGEFPSVGSSSRQFAQIFKGTWSLVSNGASRLAVRLGTISK